MSTNSGGSAASSIKTLESSSPTSTVSSYNTVPDKEHDPLPWILHHILTYETPRELSLRTMFSINSGREFPPATALNMWWSQEQGKLMLDFFMDKESSPRPEPELNLDNPNQSISARKEPLHDSGDRYMDPGNNKLFDDIYADIQRKHQPGPLCHHSDLRRICLETVFTRNLGDSDFSKALAALDYFRQLESQRRAALKSAAQRLCITRENWREELSRNLEALRWVEETQKAELYLEKKYARLFVDLRIWTMIFELASADFDKSHALARLNTLFPPSVSNLSNDFIRPSTIYRYRSIFFREIQHVALEGSAAIDSFQEQWFAVNKRASWENVHAGLENYFDQATEMIEKANSIHPSTISHSEDSENLPSRPNASNRAEALASLEERFPDYGTLHTTKSYQRISNKKALVARPSITHPTTKSHGLVSSKSPANLKVPPLKLISRVQTSSSLQNESQHVGQLPSGNLEFLDQSFENPIQALSASKEKDGLKKIVRQMTSFQSLKRGTRGSDNANDAHSADMSLDSSSTRHQTAGDPKGLKTKSSLHSLRACFTSKHTLSNQTLLSPQSSQAVSTEILTGSATSRGFQNRTSVRDSSLISSNAGPPKAVGLRKTATGAASLHQRFESDPEHEESLAPLPSHQKPHRSTGLRIVTQLSDVPEALQSPRPASSRTCPVPSALRQSASQIVQKEETLNEIESNDGQSNTKDSPIGTVGDSTSMVLFTGQKERPRSDSQNTRTLQKKATFELPAIKEAMSVSPHQSWGSGSFGILTSSTTLSMTSSRGHRRQQHSRTVSLQSSKTDRPASIISSRHSGNTQTSEVQENSIHVPSSTKRKPQYFKFTAVYDPTDPRLLPMAGTETIALQEKYRLEELAEEEEYENSLLENVKREKSSLSMLEKFRDESSHRLRESWNQKRNPTSPLPIRKSEEWRLPEKFNYVDSEIEDFKIPPLGPDEEGYIPPDSEPEAEVDEMEDVFSRIDPNFEIDDNNLGICYRGTGIDRFVVESFPMDKSSSGGKTLEQEQKTVSGEETKEERAVNEYCRDYLLAKSRVESSKCLGMQTKFQSPEGGPIPLKDGSKLMAGFEVHPNEVKIMCEQPESKPVVEKLERPWDRRQRAGLVKKERKSDLWLEIDEKERIRRVQEDRREMMRRDQERWRALRERAGDGCGGGITLSEREKDREEEKVRKMEREREKERLKIEERGAKREKERREKEERNKLERREMLFGEKRKKVGWFAKISGGEK